MNDTDLGFSVARELTSATETEWPLLVINLRKRKQLSLAVREMNLLLDHPVHQQMAAKALKRIGLDFAG